MIYIVNAHVLPEGFYRLFTNAVEMARVSSEARTRWNACLQQHALSEKCAFLDYSREEIDPFGAILADLRVEMREIDHWCTDNYKRDARGWVDTYI